MNTTTITIDLKIKRILDSLKKARRESYNDVLGRVLSNNKENADVESLRETVEILSDPETMARLAKSMDDFRHGRLVSIDDI
ncbi:MAG: antitoxin VapB family protein [Nanoarchaeota archaeon]